MRIQLAPGDVQAMMVEVNNAGMPHFFTQINQGSGMQLQWEVDNNVPPWGRVLVTLNQDGTWSSCLRMNDIEP